MAWYTILFAITVTLFTIKLIMSLVGGDFEMDVDFDGYDDFDSSSAFSFKGLVHFLLGFSSYLCLKANMTGVSKVDGIAQFGIFDYVVAVVIGVILMFALYFLYRIAMKANHSPQNPSELIDNSKGTIYINLGNGYYSVQAHTPAGTINVTALYTGENELATGTDVKLIVNGDNIMIDHFELINKN